MTAQTTDVAIIGGGIMGSAVAFRLAQRGVGVTVVERGIPGAEASSAAAGILGPQMEAEGPGPLLDLGLASRALYPSLAAELREATGIDVGYDRSGVLAAALDDAGERELGERRAWQQGRGLNVGWLSGRRGAGARAGARPRDPRRAGVSGGRAGERARAGAGVLAGGGGGGRALSDRALRAPRGDRRGRGHRRRARRRDARRGHGGGRGGELVRAWSRAAACPSTVVRPARGQLVSIETRPPLFRHVVSVHGGYLVPRRDGTVLAGSTVEMAGFRKQVTVGGLAAILTLARTLVPALAEAPVTGTWSNFRPFTEDHLPVLGATPVRGLVLATGHFRNGILLAPITAEAIAELIATGRSTIDLAPFSVTRFAA